MRLRSGESVVDRGNSHAHCSAGLVSEALTQVDSHRRSFFVEEVDLGRVVGETTCVETRDGDRVIYAVRPGRNGPTRFVLGREPEPTQYVTVILKAREEGGYVLISAWTGRKAEPEPWDRHATKRSAAFWSTHALVWQEQEQEG